MTVVLAEAQTKRHRLSNIDAEQRTADCSKCGPVRLHKTAPYNGVQRWRCATASTRAVLTRYHSPEGNRTWRNNRFLRTYGITIEEYERLLAKQGGACARCKQPPQEALRLAVDHCHTTGRVRGLLCGPCNTYLGRLEANLASLAADIAYLS